MRDTIKLHTPVKMIAHRGLSGLERENTAAAFIAAGQRSYYGIEADVHRTADGKFIIIHDDSPARVAGVKGTVEEMTFDALRCMRLRDMANTPREDLALPSLEEYVRICKEYDKQSVLELKNHMDPQDIRSIINIIRADGWLERTTFISFDLPNLICLRDLLPQQSLQFLTKEQNKKLLPLLVEYRLDLDIKFTALNAKLVDACHDNGLLVNAWTVDNPEQGRKLAALGVDFVTSNILE